MSFAYGLFCPKCTSHPPVCCHTSGWAVIEYVLFCNVLWWICYWFLILISKQSEEWSCRILTFIHGCVVSYLAIKHIFNNRCSGFDIQNAPLAEDQISFLSFMFSYFIFDFFWIHIFGNETWVIYVHHLSSILVIIQIFLSDFGGLGVSYAVAGLEFTNPYLQMRWFLRTHGYVNTSIHTVVELWFFFTFFIIRIIGGTILFYYMVTCAGTDIFMKMSMSSIYGVSLILAWQIFVYLRKKYLNRGRVDFIASRQSISPYFQRRTLDRNRVDSSDGNAQIPSENERSPMPESSSPKLESLSPKPESSSPKPESSSPKPESSSPKPDYSSPKPESFSPLPETPSPPTASPFPEKSEPSSPTELAGNMNTENGNESEKEKE